MNVPKVQIILGSTREGREGEKVAQWIFNEAQKRDDFDVEYIDLRDIPLPFFDEAVSPSYNKGEYANPLGAEWAKRVGTADGYIFVTPEYNHSIPAVLKNAIDWVYPEWNNKAAGIVSYSGGPYAGVRATQELRHIFTEVQIAPIRASIHIPFIWKAFDASGKPVEESLQKAPQHFFDNLITWTKALKTVRS
jgi:NAD(P)H-dependent FMN reductase